MLDVDTLVIKLIEGQTFQNGEGNIVHWDNTRSNPIRMGAKPLKDIEAFVSNLNSLGEWYSQDDSRGEVVIFWSTGGDPYLDYFGGQEIIGGERSFYAEDKESTKYQYARLLTPEEHAIFGTF